MPDRGLVDYFRAEAARTRSAEQWRAANPDHRALKGLMPIDVEGLLKRYGFKP